MYPKAGGSVVISESNEQQQQQQQQLMWLPLRPSPHICFAQLPKQGRE